MMPLADRLKFVAEYICNTLKLMAPKDTGNLSANAIRVVRIRANQYHIIIGGEVAPYAVYTNEPWIDDKWGGKQNPNEGWIEAALELARPMIRIIMAGAVSAEDAQLTYLTQQTTFDAQLADLWNDEEKKARFDYLSDKIKKR